MSEQLFELKGNLFTLSVLRLLTPDLAALSEQLDAKIAQAPKFFAGAPIVINLEAIQDATLDFTQLRDTLKRLAFNPVGVCSGSDSQHSSAKEAGLSVLNYAKDAQQSQQKAPSPQATAKVENEPTLVVEGTVRSGQQVYAKGRDLIVLGSVSHGAEVIADGHVHIYGTLRGRAIAGAQGDANATIFCQKLEAELVSVNGSYWISDSLQGDLWGQPAQVRQRDDSLYLSALVKG
ncbi:MULTISPECIES: septum site-determining protein MinC [Pseudoalteromonas]|uniref:Probable septum site-determining protein MinC n=1 Tax=Pseudoalteromonas ruthenica TaxID=151081 RepID=A0A0F4PKZ6_9GAMM|nr:MULTISPECIES: septum site-determining protein MinC [Pseudoalteromonas]KJY95658.1 septum site-determining protein MinC [Pseudoalteromonas ruthenica]KJZ00454.1 septum site-determining protein MinC [Pseudoalteromonas ruthenica]MCG7565593.1 septum site-determining protein MinC [Pseudoalteromonas sp. CnMc7-15]TMO87272.1 septum site-determining protein MinC [Pseudoalteromonas ruthenica]TMO94367.1 septum site-determining protein MinC [Pseudoalteromonas ruthenica]